MADDPAVTWRQADPLAIQVDANSDIWHAGHCNDLLVLDDDSLVVATQTGGLWSVAPSGTGFVLGDFDPPDFSAIAQGPDGSDHLFAGGGGLFETDASAPVPLLTWKRIQPLEDESKSPIGGILRITVVFYMRVIVLACDNGVFWSAIPPSSERKGCLSILNSNPPRTYQWRKARGLPNGMAFYGLATGPRIGPRESALIVTSSWGSGINNPSNIYFGTWHSGELVFKTADVSGGFQRLGMCATSLAACASNPFHLYAASSNADGFLLLLLRSDDGGAVWRPLGESPSFLPELLNPSEAGKTLRDDCGNLGNGWNNSIAVCPFDPDLVALAWRNAGGCFISEDGGDKWRCTDQSQHTHSDNHAVLFHPRDQNGDNLYVASDGGVALLPDRGRDGTKYVSMFNRQLHNLQFQSSPARQFYGSFSASPLREGFIAGGLQDNGNVFCELPGGPWRRFARLDDGQPTQLLPTDHVLYYFNDLAVYQDAGFDAFQHRFTGNQIPQVIPQDPGFPQTAGLGQLGSLNCVVEAVRRPTHRNDRGQFMYAIGGLREDVFGYFSDRNGDHPHWEFLFRVTDPLNDPQVITALFSETGDSVWVGTGSGRLFEFVPAVPSASPAVLNDFVVEGRVAPAGDMDAAIFHIVAAGDLAFASLTKAGNGFILRRDGLHFSKLTNGLPNPAGHYYGLELVPPLDPVVPAMVFAATDDKVYITRDLGASWQPACQGLPARPHCGDLRFVAPPDGARALYLSTFGRSIWSASV